MSLTRIIDLSIVALMVLVLVLRFVVGQIASIGAGAQMAAIAIGALAVPIVGTIFTLIALGVWIARGRSSTDGRQDFSSFAPGEEQHFIGHEQWMRNNSQRAARLGMGIAAGLFALIGAIVLLFYTPCSKFCDRPPSTCKTEAQQKQFLATCEEHCAQARKSMGNHFIEELTGCSFSNTVGGTCGERTERAIAAGLWCKEKE